MNLQFVPSPGPLTIHSAHKFSEIKQGCWVAICHFFFQGGHAFHKSLGGNVQAGFWWKKSLWIWNPPPPPSSTCSYFSWGKTAGEGNKCSQLRLNLHWNFHISVALWTLNARASFIMVTRVILVSPEHSPSDPVLKETIPLKSCFKLESRPSTLRGNAYEEERWFWPI